MSMIVDAGVLLQVQEVLSEMVYDVETCEHECEVARLKRELSQANSALSEYQQRESELIQERQQVRHVCSPSFAT